jgi:hypothetical protein
MLWWVSTRIADRIARIAVRTCAFLIVDGVIATVTLLRFLYSTTVSITATTLLWLLLPSLGTTSSLSWLTQLEEIERILLQQVGP